MIVYVLFVHKKSVSKRKVCIIFIKNLKLKKNSKKTKKPIFSGFFRWVFLVGFLLPTLPGGDAAAAVAGCGEPLQPAAGAVGPAKGRAVGVAAAAAKDQMPECAPRCCWPPGHGSGGGDSAAAVAAVDDHHRLDPPFAPGSDRSWLAAVAAVAAAAVAATDDDGCGPWRRRWEAADG